jgi:hypothetical protein
MPPQAFKSAPCGVHDLRLLEAQEIAQCADVTAAGHDPPVQRQVGMGERDGRLQESDARRHRIVRIDLGLAAERRQADAEELRIEARQQIQKEVGRALQGSIRRRGAGPKRAPCPQASWSSSVSPDRHLL